MEGAQGSLKDYIRVQKSRVLGTKIAKHIFKQIVEAIQYLHMNQIVHKDIKLDNILMNQTDNNIQIKLIDFGFAEPYNYQLSRAYCGTPSYMCP